MYGETRSRWCRDCQRRTLAVWQRQHYALHLALTMFTCGAWLPFWFILFSGRWVCHRCGEGV